MPTPHLPLLWINSHPSCIRPSGWKVLVSVKISKQTGLGRGGSAGAEHADCEFDRGEAAQVNMASNKPQGAPATPPEDLQSKL